MGPKNAARQKPSKGERETVSFEDVGLSQQFEPPAIFDPYKGLRYAPLKKHQRPKLSAQVKYVPVMKKQNQAATLYASEDDSLAAESNSTKYRGSQLTDGQIRSLFHSAKKKEKEKYQLEMDIISAPPLTKWVAPSELPLLPPPIQILRRRRPMSPSVRQLISQSKRRECRHLDHYVQVKEEQMQMENYLMAATGKDRSNLLLRRKQLLPKIVPSGLEKPLIFLERAENPIKDSAVCLFNISEHMKTERKGICPRMTKKKQGYTMVEEWVGCPEVTDIILHNLGVNHDDFLEDEDEFSLSTETPKRKFVPRIEKLGILGNAKHHLRKSITSEPKATLVGVQFSSYVKSQDTWQGKRSGRHLSCLTAADRQSVYNFNASGSSASLWIADMAVSWSADRECKDRVWITEVGCTADLGKNELCSFRLTNMGMTAINYKFVRKDNEDAFDLNKYRLTRFIIDNDEKIILPGETIRVPIMYKSMEPGYYSEDWQVLTRPVLGNGAEIIIRMWGITRSFDTFHRERDLIDSTINHRETLAIVQDRVQKLVYNLLLKEESAVDGRFKIELLGPDLFRFHNPSLHYHTAEVFRLGKLLEMLEDRKIKSASQKKSANRLEYLEESTTHLESSRISSENIVPILSSVLFNNSDAEDEEEEEGENLGIGLTGAIAGPASEHSLSGVTPLPSKKATTETWQGYLIRKINAELKTKNLMSTAVESVGYSPIINIANCDLAVDDLCRRILEEIDVLEEQDAYFRIVAQQISRLFFKTENTAPNIGTTVAFTLLAKALDEFSDYAINLKLQCCEIWLGKKAFREKKEKVEEFQDTSPEVMAVVNTDSFNDREEQQQAAPDIPVDNFAESSVSVLEDVNYSKCEDFEPMEDLDPSSYHSQYYDRIYTKMYLLLCEYVETLDTLLTHVDVKKVVKRPPQAILPGIQRVKYISTRTDKIESLLNAPLPPMWVRLAQRMDAAANLNNAKTAHSSHEKSISDVDM